MVFTPTNVACAAPIIMVALLGWHQRWISDDGWINIRVVEQFLAGNGPVYNAGERVEVTTSTLWFWFLLAGAVALPSRRKRVLKTLESRLLRNRHISPLFHGGSGLDSLDLCAPQPL